MAEITKPDEKIGWSRAMLGVGVFVIIAALFVGAGMKEGGGMIPKYMAFAGLGLIVISLVGRGVSFFTSKVQKRREPTP